MIPLRRSISPKRSPLPLSPPTPIPFLARIAPFFILLTFLVLLSTSLHPSPWTSTSLPLFLHPPSLYTSSSPNSHSPVQGCSSLPLTTLEPRESSVILILLRESDLSELLPTLENFESKFNQYFNYPYLIISSPDDPPFPPEFRSTVLSHLPRNRSVEYSVIPLEYWKIPEWLDSRRVREGFKRQEKEGVMYGRREGYHHMIRFYSGLFARLKELEKYKWFWRLEPGVKYFCEINYDPFRYLSIQGKEYGFAISVVEDKKTIPTLFETVREYGRDKGLEMDRGMKSFLINEKRVDGREEEEFTGFHFWTNFEIGNLDFFRSREYQDYFDHLDKAGGFYTERWGDAPVRALGLGLLSSIDKIHYFEDFGYQHDWFFHCPSKSQSKVGSLTAHKSLGDGSVGCRCECPKAGDLQGRKKGRELRDMDTDWEYSSIDFWKKAVREYGQ